MARGKLTPAQIEEARGLVAGGVPVARVARRFGVVPTALRNHGLHNLYRERIRRRDAAFCALGMLYARFGE